MRGWIPRHIKTRSSYVWQAKGFCTNMYIICKVYICKNANTYIYRHLSCKSQASWSLQIRKHLHHLQSLSKVYSRLSAIFQMSHTAPLAEPFRACGKERAALPRVAYTGWSWHCGHGSYTFGSLILMAICVIIIIVVGRHQHHHDCQVKPIEPRHQKADILSRLNLTHPSQS